MKVKVFSTSSYTKNDKQKYVGYFITDFGGNIAVNKVITDVELHDNDLIEVAKSKQYGTYLREPVIDLTPLKDETDTTAIYKHPKDPIGVSVGDIVIYTLRVYNEGEINTYASSITDYLPSQLEFVNDEFNAGYGWQIDASGRKITTTYLDKDEIYPEETLLKAFDGETLDYKELKVKCKVVQSENLDKVITNIAEVTAMTDEEENELIDRDSKESNTVLPNDKDLPEYKGNKDNKNNIPVVIAVRPVLPPSPIPDALST